MSRYGLGAVATFEEVVVGWDEGPGHFYLQCFPLGTDPEEAPDIWVPIGLSCELDELVQRLGTYGVALPQDVLRALVEDAGVQGEHVGDHVVVEQVPQRSRDHLDHVDADYVDALLRDLGNWVPPRQAESETVGGSAAWLGRLWRSARALWLNCVARLRRLFRKSRAVTYVGPSLHRRNADLSS